ncbi:type-F conjugative transfer system secretin TraK, partial [Salmonella enterica subsp. enterica serovar Enteritidis]
MRKNKPYKRFFLAAGWVFTRLVLSSGSGTL